MKSNYTYICDLDDEYEVFYSNSSNKYYKKRKDEIIELNESELEVVRNIPVKSKKMKVVSSRKKEVAFYAISALAALILVGSTASYVTHKYNNYITYYVEDCTVDGSINLVNYELLKNNSFDKSVKKDLVLLVDMYLKEASNSKQTMRIAYNISKLDASNYTEINEELLNSIFTFNNGKFISRELLDYYTGDKNINYNHNVLVKYILSDNELYKSVLNGENLKVRGIPNGISLDNIDDIDTYVLYLINDSFNNSVRDNLNIIRYNPIITSNMFTKELEVRDCKNQISYYYHAINGEFISITSEHYLEEFENLYNNEAGEIDIHNETDRFLLYCYADTLLAKGGDIGEDEAKTIYRNMISGRNYCFNDYISFYKYLDHGEANYSQLQNLSSVVGYTDNIYLIQNINQALKIENALGNISDEDYELYITYTVDNIEYMIPEEMEVFKNLNLYNKATDDKKLSLLN